jgi:hypothetical protein
MKISSEMALSDALPALSLSGRAMTWISLPHATFFLRNLACLRSVMAWMEP